MLGLNPTVTSFTSFFLFLTFHEANPVYMRRTHLWACANQFWLQVKVIPEQTENYSA